MEERIRQAVCLGENDECSYEAEETNDKTPLSHAGYDFIQFSEKHSEDEAGQMRNRRVFERLEPFTVAEAIEVSEAVRIVDDVERSGNKAKDPDEAHLCKVWSNVLGFLPAGHPGEEHVVEGLCGHRPCRGVQEGGNLGYPPLEEERRKHDACPEHAVGVRSPFDGKQFDGKDQAEQIDLLRKDQERVQEEASRAQASSTVKGDRAGERSS